jgi:hypothetical protein
MHTPQYFVTIIVLRPGAEVASGGKATDQMVEHRRRYSSVITACIEL